MNVSLQFEYRFGTTGDKLKMPLRTTGTTTSTRTRSNGMITNTAAFARLMSTTTSSSSSSSSSSNTSSSSSSFFNSTRWKYAAKAIKYARIPSLILSVYSLGYINGITDYMRNPKKYQQYMFESILTSVGVHHVENDNDSNNTTNNTTTNNNESNKVHIAVQGEWMHDKQLKLAQKIALINRRKQQQQQQQQRPVAAGNNHYNFQFGYGNSIDLPETTIVNDRQKELNKLVQLVNVAYVCEKIINSAKQLVSQKLLSLHQQQEDIHIFTGGLKPTAATTTTATTATTVNEEEIEKWTTAYDSLDTTGHLSIIPNSNTTQVHQQTSQTKWKFVLIDVPMVNAFVSETTPYTIYVTTALLENVVSNDDELALVLGHELSHLLLAHSSKSMLLERNLKTLEVVSGYYCIITNYLVNILVVLACLPLYICY